MKTSAIDLIAKERERQINVEGWTPEHDEQHDKGELALAAGAYAIADNIRSKDNQSPYFWPWREEDWKPTPDDRIRELVKAGALIVAEIERLQMPAKGGLTLAEVAAYLPYNVKFIYPPYNVCGLHLIIEKNVTHYHYKNNTLWTLNGVNDVFGDYCLVTKENGDTYPIHSCKLLLRPLSDLTKQITHNGETFVPIEAIAKIESPNITGSIEKIHSITKFNRGISFNSRQIGVSYKYEGVTVEITHYKGAIFHKRVIDGNDSWVFSYFHNYPKIVKSLHEWHFDTENLIGRGLAININTIKEGGE